MMSTLLLRTYYALSITCTISAAMCMVLSFMSHHWEVVHIDWAKVANAADNDPLISVDFHGQNADDGDAYLVVTTFGDPANSSGSDITDLVVTSTIYVPIQWQGGLWSTCDNIDDSTRALLLQSGGIIRFNRCLSYLDFDDDDLQQYPHLDLLMSLSRSAVACAIVALIAVFVSIILGLFAAVRQQIVFAMITGVCFFAASVYTFFAVTLMLLRRSELSDQDSWDTPEVTSQGRIVTSGWSMYICWLVCLLTTAAGLSWTSLSNELKKQRANYMFTSQYDQICSM